MRILFCINEAAPLYKMGGLGDVGGDLPKALNSRNCDIRLALPFHPEIKPAHVSLLTKIKIHFGSELLDVSIYLTQLPHTGIPVYLFSETKYLSKSSSALDNDIQKYAVFSIAVAQFCFEFTTWTPQCLHLHDWHVSLIPLLLRHRYNTEIPSVLTIHNHRYVGSTSLSLLPLLHINADSCQILKWDQQDQQINLLMEGIAHADAITTVSPSYREEILKESSLLSQVLQTKSSNFQGITNGLDYHLWNPQNDSLLAQTYDLQSFAIGKKTNKHFIQAMLKLPINDDPLIVFIGRVDAQQKGIPLIIEAIEAGIFNLPHLQFVFLGTGDSTYEAKLHTTSAPYQNLKIITRYDETLAHLLYASGDFIIIPSDYEPCGLIQLIAMRYGTIPIAHQTGGLKDTISASTGFLYSPNTLTEFSKILELALKSHISGAFKPYVSNAMSVRFTWEKASRQYLKLYSLLVAI